MSAHRTHLITNRQITSATRCHMRRDYNKYVRIFLVAHCREIRNCFCIYLHTHAYCVWSSVHLCKCFCGCTLRKNGKQETRAFRCFSFHYFVQPIKYFLVHTYTHAHTFRRNERNFQPMRTVYLFAVNAKTSIAWSSWVNIY